jgi:hypothetical protein
MHWRSLDNLPKAEMAAPRVLAPYSSDEDDLASSGAIDLTCAGRCHLSLLKSRDNILPSHWD